MKFTFEADLRTCPGVFATVIVHSIRPLHQRERIRSDELLVLACTSLAQAKIVRSAERAKGDCNRSNSNCCRLCNMAFYVRAGNSTLVRQFMDVREGDCLIMEMHLSQDRSYNQMDEINGTAMALIPSRIITNLGAAPLDSDTELTIQSVASRKLVLE